MGARRDRLKAVECQHGDGTHPGLWLDRYLSCQTDDPRFPQEAESAKNAKSTLVREAASIPAPADYRTAYGRWRQLLAADPTVLLVEAEAAGRVVVGLGAKGAAEVGIRLDPTWGVPVLPGSALKGLASTAAHRLLADPEWRKGANGGAPGPSHRELFGTTDEQGLVHFLDAWWIPAGDGRPLHPDVMTSHHQDYYTTGSAPPSDTDSPNPVAFVSASGRFLVALQAANDAWRQAALEILALGLSELGIGAKTNAGYGRMIVHRMNLGAQNDVADPPPPPSDEAEVARLLALVGSGSAAHQVPRALQQLTGAARASYAREAVKKLGAKWVRQRAQEGKDWAVKLQEALPTPGP